MEMQCARLINAKDDGIEKVEQAEKLKPITMKNLFINNKNQEHHIILKMF